ncbi:hypothetical protein BGZ83_001264 [Gryganskiella cystojenkinii]|nr:hypothetical protein BGZ83_001264 [Gryganskiella cystojenkinii]
MNDLYWALQKRKRNAKLQSVSVTSLADAVVNKKMRLMLQEEVDATSQGSASTDLQPYESEDLEAGDGYDIVDDRVEDSSTTTRTPTSLKPSSPSARPAPVVASYDKVDMTIQKQMPVHKRVTILEAEFLSESGSDYIHSGPSSTRSSMNSIEFLLINHLVGPGTASSRLTTNDRLMFNDVDISLSLMNVRRSLVKKQNDIKESSDLLKCISGNKAPPTQFPHRLLD